MSAYLVVRVDITDPQKYQEYMKLTPAAIEHHGGRFVARGGRVETLEGPAETNRVVLVEFPSFEQAKAFYDSDEYGRAKAARAGAANAQILVVEGVG